MTKTANLIKKNYDTQVYTIAVSDRAVIPDLPTTTRGGTGILKDNPSFRYSVAMGSVCICKNGNDVEKYVLFSDGWVKAANSFGGSSGTPSGGTELNIATDEEVENIFT